EELLGGDSPKKQMAGLWLALALEKFDLRLPYSKLFSSTDPGVPYATVAVLERHAGAGGGRADAMNELIKLLRTDSAVWAARSLGAIAPVKIAQELNNRVAEIDAQLGDKSNPGAKSATPGKPEETEQPTSKGI